jgi:hypothetical protein
MTVKRADVAFKAICAYFVLGLVVPSVGAACASFVHGPLFLLVAAVLAFLGFLACVRLARLILDEVETFVLSVRVGPVVLGVRWRLGTLGLYLPTPEALTWGLVEFARLLAGSRHAHLAEAWAADLYGDPEVGQRPPARRRLTLAAGFVVAALRLRLDDATALAWRPIDALLASWHASRLAMLTPVTVAVGLVLSREGLYGLISDADNLGVIAAAPYAAIKGLRKYRQIDSPKRPEKKAEPANRPEC